MHRLNFFFHAIGDQVCTTSFPENYYVMTGEKVIINDPKIWAFKYNPYVIHGQSHEYMEFPSIDIMPDTRVQEQVKNYVGLYDNLSFNSQAEWLCANVGAKNPPLRHPRLYIYETESIIPNKITVHTTASDRSKAGEPAIREKLGEDAIRVMAPDVIDSIIQNYKGWDIVQIGSETDVTVPGAIDKRGGTKWDMAKEIATSARFIGVNSGPMHIAYCYPRVDKRIVLMEFSKKAIARWRPGDMRNFNFSWFDPSATYFNKHHEDIAYTFAHTKI